MDDGPAIRALIRAVLQDEYRVLEAANGADALRLARSERPDLMLLDVVLPGISGLEVCRRLRQLPATASLPVLLLSGVAREPAEVGTQGCLVKPFGPAQLVARVREALAVPAGSLR